MRIYYTFPDGKVKTLTFSYDDGNIADRRLVPIFNQYGLKATFNLNYGLMHRDDRVNLGEVEKLYQGHEIATHTYSHPSIARCPVTQIYWEIMEDRKGWEALLGYPVRGHAYPNGSYSEGVKRIFKDAGIVYARPVEEREDLGSYQEFDLPDDWMEWRATCHHTHNLMALAEKFINCQKTRALKCMYVWGHSYEFDRDDNWELIENFCKLISGRDEIWYATNIEIRDYMEACNRLIFAADAHFVYNPGAADVWLSVEEKIVKVPGGMQVML